MRIIAGEFGGRSLLPPPSDKTRPITDRAKQSLFDALAVAVNWDGAIVLDCFAGTGSMGLECLSRGAAKAVFIERDRGALGNLRKNIDALGVKDRTAVLPVNAYGAGTPAVVSRDGKLRIAFIDPPYVHMEFGKDRQKVDRLMVGLLKEAMEEGGRLIMRHHTRVTVDAAALGVVVEREMNFGEMGITWLMAAEAKTLDGRG